MSSKPSVPERQDEPLVRIARAAARLLDAPLAVIAAREGGELRIAGAHGGSSDGLAGLQRLVTAIGRGVGNWETGGQVVLGGVTGLALGFLSGMTYSLMQRPECGYTGSLICW